MSQVKGMLMAKEHNLAVYWGGIQRALDGRLIAVKEYSKHPASGSNAETYFRDMLAEYLPRRYSVEPGFVVNDTGEMSDLIDALIVDTHHVAPLSSEPHFKIFPAEAVVGAIEITSAPNSNVTRSGHRAKIPKMADDILKLSRVRRIARTRKIFSNMVEDDGSSPPSLQTRELHYDLAPRCFLITFGSEWSKEKTYRAKLLDARNLASNHSDSVWLNAAFSLKHGMYHFEPYTAELTHFATNALLEFVLFINKAVASVPTGLIDVARYRPTVPEQPLHDPASL